MLERWGSTLSSDPSFNPNLDLGEPGYKLAFPPRVAYPWRSAASIDRAAPVR